MALRLKVASVDCVYIHEGIEVSCLCSPLTESCSSDSRPSLLCFENRLVETAAQNFIPLQILKSREGFFVRLYPDDRHNQNPRCHLENLASRLANKLLGHIFHSCDVYRRIISRMSINIRVWYCRVQQQSRQWSLRRKTDSICSDTMVWYHTPKFSYIT